MKKEIDIEAKEEVLSLVTDITYSCVPDWYGAVYTDLKMNLIIPKHRENHKKQPLIIWICGGAYSVVSNTAWMPELMYFARAGFVIASVEYRTSNKGAFPAGLIDVKSAIRFLKAHAEEFCIDVNNIYVMGESAGATYSVLAGTTAHVKKWDRGYYLEYDSSIQGVVDFYGPVDFSEMCVKKNDEVPGWVLTAFLGEDKEEENKMEASPINHITENTVPMLILHGIDDVTVPISQSDLLYEKLVEKNIETEYYRFKHAGHGEDVFYQESVKKIILDFLNRQIEKHTV